jgi:hypothetical protein
MVPSGMHALPAALRADMHPATAGRHVTERPFKGGTCSCVRSPAQEALLVRRVHVLVDLVLAVEALAAEAAYQTGQGWQCRQDELSTAPGEAKEQLQGSECSS